MMAQKRRNPGRKPQHPNQEPSTFAVVASFGLIPYMFKPYFPRPFMYVERRTRMEMQTLHNIPLNPQSRRARSEVNSCLVFQSPFVPSFLFHRPTRTQRQTTLCTMFFYAPAHRQSITNAIAHKRFTAPLRFPRTSLPKPLCADSSPIHGLHHFTFYKPENLPATSPSHPVLSLGICSKAPYPRQIHRPIWIPQTRKAHSSRKVHSPRPSAAKKSSTTPKKKSKKSNDGVPQEPTDYDLLELLFNFLFVAGCGIAYFLVKEGIL